MNKITKTLNTICFVCCLIASIANMVQGLETRALVFTLLAGQMVILEKIDEK